MSIERISNLVHEAKEALSKTHDFIALEAVKVQYLGKKGMLTAFLKGLSELSAEDRPRAGQLVNEAKQAISSAIEEKASILKEEMLKEKLAKERVDVTLPGRFQEIGSLHPITQVKTIIADYFSHLGFDIVSGPEVETTFYNFEALNIPLEHPARALHDTFYFGDGRLLRTHTSTVQIRAMEHQKPPFRLIAPGRVYRCDSDLTHTPMFHQVEGLVIDKDATLSKLRGLLEDFFAYFFGVEPHLRFRPHYFPFTEPSCEVDLQCVHCEGEGCRICKFSGWLEVLGCGMVHPKVLEAVGIDNTWQGFAFGMGIDRLAMLYFGIPDLRMMFENDLAFLRQF